MRTPIRTRFQLSLVAGLTVLAHGALLSPADARSDRDERTKAAQASQRPQNPLKLIVSIRRQRIAVWDGTRKVAEAPISTGKPGHETPTGIFSVLEKNRVHFSNLYDNAPMPFMQRLTWSGVALHAGALPGYPASHGCIRMPFSFSRQLFGMTRIGARVIVARDEAQPQPIAHPKLPVPLPPTQQIASASGTERDTGVDMLIGVSRAAAADATVAPHYQPQRTRASVLAERRAEISALDGAIAKAESGRELAETRAGDAAAELRLAQDTLADARAAMRSLAGARDTAKRERAAAEARLQSFGNRSTRALATADDAAIEILVRQEDEIERRIEAAIFEVADLEADIAEHERTVAARTAEVAAKANQQSAAHAALVHAKEAIKAARDAKVTAERRLQRRDMPVTVFISRKTGMLSVRQGFDPLFEAPVRIDNPELPIGTHVFTALDYAPGERALVWSVVSVPSHGTEARSRGHGRANSRNAASKASANADRAPTGPPLTPDTTLSRIHIDDDVLERIAEYMRPGSAFLISDLGVSNETGKYTDFVLLTR